MPLTMLDPQTALIAIDLQNGIVAMPVADPIEPVIERSCALAEAFREHGLPVVLVHVVGLPAGRTERPRPFANPPAGWADFIPQLTPQGSDHVIAKRSQGAFAKTGLEQHLLALGVTQVVLAGVATSAGVESTARQAYEHGFNVTLAIDAMTDRTAEAHTNSITQVFPRLGESGTTAEIIALLKATRTR